jgi:hypothetical protein
MEFSVLGLKINLLNAAIFLVLGMLIATHTTCACSKVSVKEAMTNLANAASLDHNNNADLLNSWVSKSHTYAGNMGYKSVLDKHENYKGTPVPLENTLFYFQDNEFKAECCPSTYSTSTGCACTSSDQMKYLNERGGNRTLPTEF